jgi:hypothetical protein
MDTLFVVIISGMAVSYFLEFVSSIVGEFFSPRLIKLILTAPLAYFACWLLGLTAFNLTVSGLAAAFISLALLQLVNRPVTIQNLNTRR